MEPTILITALQAIASALNSGECRCWCGGCCCDELRDHAQELTRYLAGLDHSFTETEADYPVNRR